MGITVLRCDDRLIHGQCIVKVLNDYKIDYIILVDAFTASNPVMSNIYKMSVPPNVQALNIGPMSNRKGTKKATYFSYLLDSEAAACEELHAMGIRVYFQQVPGEKEMEWKEAF